MPLYVTAGKIKNLWRTDDNAVIHEIKNLRTDAGQVFSPFPAIHHEVQAMDVGGGRLNKVFAFTTAIDITYDLHFRIGWDAPSARSYVLNVLVNGVVRYSTTNDSLGPPSPEENSYREMSVTENGVRLSAGDTIDFRVWTNAPEASQRRIRDGVVTMT